jgi:hypothetical protein
MKTFQPKKTLSSTLSCHNVLMTNLKSSNLDSMTLKLKTLMGRLFFIYFFVCAKFHGKIIIKCCIS